MKARQKAQPQQARLQPITKCLSKVAIIVTERERKHHQWDDRSTKLTEP